MPRQLTPLPDALVGKVFTAAEAIAANMTRQRLRFSGVNRVFRGMYADPALGKDLHVLLDAAARLLPKGAAIGGPHAVFRYGLPLPIRSLERSARAAELVAAGHTEAEADRLEAEEYLLATPLQVYLPVDSNRDSRAYLDVSEVRISPSHVTHSHGVPLLHPKRLFLELAADKWTLERLVCFLDAAVHNNLTTEHEVGELLPWARRRRGVVLARQALALMDAGAESPMESLLRLIIVLAGLPRPRANVDIRCGTRFVARPDLQYTEWKISIEYDGSPHATSEQRAIDERRRYELRQLGWVTLTFTAEEVLRAPWVVVARVRAELAARGAAV